MPFCTDCDLLLYEPELLNDAAFISQTLARGTADLADTRLTVAGADLVAAHVRAEDVVVLGGTISGCFPIVSVDSPTTMTLSILYEGTFPGTPDPVPGRIGSATGLTFIVRTFYPQRRLVADLLRRSIGIDPTAADVPAPVILNPAAFQRANTLGTLHMIYSALAAAADAPETCAARADLYRRLYRRELAACAIHLDLDADGRIDTIRRPSVITFTRA